MDNLSILNLKQNKKGNGFFTNKEYICIFCWRNSPDIGNSLISGTLIWQHFLYKLQLRISRLRFLALWINFAHSIWKFNKQWNNVNWFEVKYMCIQMLVRYLPYPFTEFFRSIYFIYLIFNFKITFIESVHSIGTNL